MKHVTSLQGLSRSRADRVAYTGEMDESGRGRVNGESHEVRWRGGRARALRADTIVAALLTLGIGLAALPALATSHRRPAHAARFSHPVAKTASAALPASAAAAAASAALVGAAASASASELSRWCRRLSSEVPGVAQPACQASGLVAGDGRSVQGVPLWTRDVLPRSGAPRFKVLLLGGIHGDELASVALAFDWIARSYAAQTLAQAANTPQTSTAGVAWRFVPLLNPDGLLHAPSTRVNAHGVDLNRNFPTADWARDAQPYWVQRTKKDPRRFPGTQPLSEPESRWLLQQIEAFHPDLIVSVHAPYGLLDFDGPPPAPHRLGSLQLDPVGVYPGSLGNYGGLVRQVPVMTLELKDARQVSPAELAAMWSDLQRWIAQRVGIAGAQANAQGAGKSAGGTIHVARRH